MTIVSQLITDARSRHGAFAVRAIEVESSLLDSVMDHVLALGGQVDLDSAVVEGIEVRELAADEPYPRVWLHDDDEPHQLTPLTED